MKVDRNELESKIEEAVMSGIYYGEEIDITTKNIMDIIEPLIRVVEAAVLTPKV